MVNEWVTESEVQVDSHVLYVRKGLAASCGHGCSSMNGCRLKSVPESAESVHVRFDHLREYKQNL